MQSIKRKFSVPSRLLAAALCALGAQHVQADELSYSYVDLSYVHNDGADGGAITGSIDIGSNVRLFAGGLFASQSGVDSTGLSAGAGYIVRFNDNANLIIDAGVAYAKVDAGFFEADDTDALVNLTLRFAPNDQFEVEPGIGYLIGDADEAVFGVQARYWLTNAAAVQFGISDTSGSGDPTFSVGFRFGNQRR